MKKINFLMLFLTVVFFALYLVSCTNSQKNDNPEVKAMSKEDSLDYGKYLVTTMGCNDCHSPKKMEENKPVIISDLMLSGYPSDRKIVKFNDQMIKEGFVMFYPDFTAAAGPWGVSFAANISSDQTGIGNWTEEQFKKSLTQGKYKGIDNSRMLMPPMPWENFVNLKDTDVHAIFSYLKSIKPVNNVVPPIVMPDDM